MLKFASANSLDDIVSVGFAGDISRDFIIDEATARPSSGGTEFPI
jgi:hypothetical protein